MGTGRDTARIEISTNNGLTWTQLANYTGAGVFGAELGSQDTGSPEWNDVNWQEAQIDLRPYTSAVTISLRFSLEVNDDGVASKGWIFDNLMVKSVSIQASSNDVFLSVILKNDEDSVDLIFAE
jgi:hypothetical protein